MKLSKTPAPPKERIYGSKVNPKESSKDLKTSKNIQFDAKTIATISKKVKEHNDEHPQKKISITSAKSVVRRGMGAYSSTHRPTIKGGKPNSRVAWGLARLNAFTYKIVHGKSKSGKYTQDDDLINELGYSVKKYAKGGLLAPNGKPSNLTAEQYKLVRTPEFKAWFGDWENDPKNASKVVDDNGEPLVVYHGTLQKFTVFNTHFDNGTWHGKGAYFTSSLKDLKTNYVTTKNDIYLQCYLNVRKPLVVGKKSEGTWFEKEQREIIKQQLIYYRFPRVNYAYENSWDSDNLEKIVRNEFNESNSGQVLNSIYRELGFDGIIFLSPHKLKGHTAPLKTKHFVCFNSNQIKLADGSNTTFDGSKPDIRYDEGGKLDSGEENFGKPSDFDERIFIHETNKEDADSIIKNGFKPKENKVITYGVYTIPRNWKESLLFKNGVEIEIKLKPNKKIFWTNSDRPMDYYLGYGNKFYESLYKKINEGIISPNEAKYDDKQWHKSKEQFSRRMENWLKENGYVGIQQGGEIVLTDLSAFIIKNKFEDGGELSEPLKEDTVGRLNDPHFSDVAYYEKGGSAEEQDETYKKWKSLVNMSYSELRRFYESEEGREAGLSSSEASKQGIDSGRESARWIMKMKNTKRSEWTPEMWRWAKKQISFISRMSGNKGDLYDKDGNKTRKHTSLLIWGHNPKKSSSMKYKDGGTITEEAKSQKIFKKPHTIEEIAEHHGKSVDFIQEQLKIGRRVEMEHTNSSKIANTIALHHLYESPKYYERLKRMEMNIEAEKLKGYYAYGAMVGGQKTCEVKDEDGERKIDPESIYDLTECVMSLPQTKALNYDFVKDDYTPERKELHKEIIKKVKENVTCVERKQPIAILMGGSPASGKSTFLKKYRPFLLSKDIYKIDADEIRAMLPEYKGYNASQTHLETKDIVNRLLSDRSIGVPCKFDLIYDGTMNNTKSYLPLIDTLKQLKYKVFIIYIDKVPKDVVVERALMRYKKSGRFVPLEVIDDFYEKGTAAFNTIKNEVDGWMLVDGSTPEYKIIDKGGEPLPKDRDYSKIGKPILVNTNEVIMEYKKGGKLGFDPDNKGIKGMVTHKSGSAGGMLVGKRHSEGGIQAINKGTGQPLEMEGGEVVITRNAVSDGKLREFEGEMLTNREILSRINESGGGVSFEKGGETDSSNYAKGGEMHTCGCMGKKYNYGGKVMSDYEILHSMSKENYSPKQYTIKHTKEYKIGGEITINEKSLPSLPDFRQMAIEIKSPFVGENEMYKPLFDKYNNKIMYFKNGNRRSTRISVGDAYISYLYDNFGVKYRDLEPNQRKALEKGDDKHLNEFQTKLSF